MNFRIISSVSVPTYVFFVSFVLSRVYAAFTLLHICVYLKTTRRRHPFSLWWNIPSLLLLVCEFKWTFSEWISTGKTSTYVWSETAKCCLSSGNFYDGHFASLYSANPRACVRFVSLVSSVSITKSSRCPRSPSCLMIFPRKFNEFCEQNRSTEPVKGACKRFEISSHFKKV